jgi:hypothetical protein
MVGQWPHGLSLHLDNLKWALGEHQHQSWVVTTEEIQKKYQPKYPSVRFFSVPHRGMTFIPFWDIFPRLVKEQKIDGNSFLLMEQDIFFVEKIGVPSVDPQVITNYLPLSRYHAMTLNGELYHHRVWEGANLLHRNLIHGAIREGIKFTFTKNYFFEKERAAWEEKLGGKIGMIEFKAVDTMDEMCYYCPMRHNTRTVHEDKAVHLRGPETIHRKHPTLYHHMTPEGMAMIQKELRYLDLYVILAAFYLAGNYKSIDGYELHKMKPENKGMFKRLRVHGKEWLGEAHDRLEHICNLMASN